jgi:hypothetical protein
VSSKIVHFLKQILSLGFLLAMLWLGWKVAHGNYYKSGTGLGYNMGLIGGLMMLTLLLYSLRKHIKFMQRLGKLKHWFRIHMILGVLGPTLVLFHSAFRFGSLNAAVALYCMLLVAISGLIGRFVYTRIHKGLYGSRSTLKGARAELAGSGGDVKPRLHPYPDVEQWLKDFEHEALETKRGLLAGVWYFLSFDVRRVLLIWRSKHNIQHVQHALGGGEEDVQESVELIQLYLSQIQTVAQFKKFEQIFSAWHVLHIPLMYMMVATAIFHVIWVHMY